MHPNKISPIQSPIISQLNNTLINIPKDNSIKIGVSIFDKDIPGLPIVLLSNVVSNANHWIWYAI
jgi:hypothetical protein